MKPARERLRDSQLILMDDIFPAVAKSPYSAGDNLYRFLHRELLAVRARPWGITLPELLELRS